MGTSVGPAVATANPLIGLQQTGERLAPVVQEFQNAIEARNAAWETIRPASVKMSGFGPGDRLEPLTDLTRRAALDDAETAAGHFRLAGGMLRELGIDNWWTAAADAGADWNHHVADLLRAHDSGPTDGIVRALRVPRFAVNEATKNIEDVVRIARLSTAMDPLVAKASMTAKNLEEVTRAERFAQEMLAKYPDQI